TGEKIKKQLIQNKYYLSFLNKEIHSYTYVSDECKLFSLNSEEELIEANFETLLNTLSNQELYKIDNLDALFNPSNYLVSPFNSTTEFINDKFFLTNQQDEIKETVIKQLIKSGLTFISICGNAGTGKTLLTYDIAKESINKKLNVLIIHCGILNNGHKKLINKFSWDIIAIKEFQTKTLSDYNLIIIDETQRIYKSQLLLIIDQVKANNGKCIFSYDNKQCLRKTEMQNNIPQLIEKETSSKVYKLTEKIRTNKEIATFINGLFNKGNILSKDKITNVELKYFYDEYIAKQYIEYLQEQDWKIINYTQSKYDNCPYDKYNIIEENDTAHSVIGQEFEKVVAIIDNYFYYKENELTTKPYYYSKDPYYHPTKMLYQIVTRTRKKLYLIIINNPEVLERCLGMLSN
ncbi:MAG: hypothetical protein RLZZ175_3149, partial [Bacteroidota bacterium]